MFQAKQATYIFYADKPPRLGGKEKKISIQDAEKILGIKYSENLVLANDVKISDLAGVEASSSEKKFKRQIINLFNNPNDNIILCKMETGHGVFARNDIKPNSVIGIYSGTITRNSAPGYKNPKDESFDYPGLEFRVSTVESRGLMSYLNHLTAPIPDNAATLIESLSNEKKKYTFLNMELTSTIFSDEKFRKKVQTANTEVDFIIVNNIPLIAVISTTRIKAGDQLGYPYCNNHWKYLSVTPDFFDKDGKLIDRTHYIRTYGQLNLVSQRKQKFIHTGETQILKKQLLDCKTMTIMLKGDDDRQHTVHQKYLIEALDRAKAITSQEKDFFLQRLLLLQGRHDVIQHIIEGISSTKAKLIQLPTKGQLSDGVKFNISSKEKQWQLYQLSTIINQSISIKKSSKIFYISSAWLLTLKELNNEGFLYLRDNLLCYKEKPSNHCREKSNLMKNNVRI